MEHVAEGGGEVEVAVSGVGRAARGAKRVENRGDVVAAGVITKGVAGRGGAIVTPREAVVVVLAKKGTAAGQGTAAGAGVYGYGGVEVAVSAGGLGALPDCGGVIEVAVAGVGDGYRRRRPWRR